MDSFVLEGMMLRDMDRTPTQDNLDSGRRGSESGKVRLLDLGSGSPTFKRIGRVRGKSF